MEIAHITTGPKALNIEQQKHAYERIYDHLNVLLNAPCTRFPHYPFVWKEGECSVYVTAIVEHFEDEQQFALVTRLNKKLKQMNLCSNVPNWASEFLRARLLRRHDGGIQFKVKEEISETEFMEIVKGFDSDCANMWTHVKNFTDFLDHCQIRFHIKPFGETTAKLVTFKAYHGTPIILMMWILRQLECYQSRNACGFGQVIITLRNGLPDAGEDHSFHYKSGLINWD